MIRIVLCRPLGPRNVGSVLRVIANFGPAELVLVAPPRPSLLVHPDFEQMSHGVEDAAARIRVVDALPAALAEATRSYGFTSRARDHRPLSDWRAARGRVVAQAHDEGELVALVFGSEENGLTGEEVAPLQELLRMPTTDEHTSLNLAMAVGVVLSTIFFERAPSAAAGTSSPVRGADRAFLVAHLEDALGAATTTAPARRDLAASIRRVFQHAPLETRDVRAWHLLARALGSERTPADFGLAPASPRRTRESDRTQGEEAR